MNNQHYQNEWQALAACSGYYLQLLQHTPEVQLRQKEEESSWSLLQILEHLVGIEVAVLQYLQKKKYTPIADKGSMPNGLRALLLQLALKSPLRFKAPRIEALLPKNTTSPHELAMRWQEVREQLADYIEHFPPSLEKKPVFRHPRAGGLTLRQTLQFICDHMNHHRHQTEAQRARVA